MKFSAEWLKDLSGSKESPEKLAEILSSHAFETELDRPQAASGVIVAKVLKVEKHPNADRLRVITLTDGQKTISPVVCGAWNFEAGATVPLALPGAVIPHDQHDPEQKSFMLTKATIRGIESQGMICSGKELGLSDDGSGILILDDTLKLGESFGDSGVTVFDISAPANRPDLIGYRGVAREIAALTGSRLNFQEAGKLKAGARTLKVSIQAKDACPKYYAAKLKVKLGDSPEFIQQRLKASGLRPINNIVDITNYVMLETGQPLHAFDAKAVTGKIVVRKSLPNERITTLDHLDRALPKDALVIADESNATLAIAGIIGGEQASVSSKTDEIILEAANFQNVSIRRTARALGLRTDASARFEKGLPLSFVDDALSAAIDLLKTHASAELLELAKAGREAALKQEIKLNTKDVSQLLGLELKPAEQKKILTRFGFKTTGSESLKVTVPAWRPDVSIWQDLSEEIGRFVGLNRIVPVPIQMSPSSNLSDPDVKRRQKTAEILAGLDFSEIYTYSFVSGKDLEAWGIDQKSAIEVANPLSGDQQYLRTNLLVNDRKTAEFNSRFGDTGQYFDIGNVYWMAGGKIVEETYLCISAFGKKGQPVHETVIGALLALAAKLKVTVSIVQDNPESAKIELAGKKAGYAMVAESPDYAWSAVHVKFKDLWAGAKEPTFVPPSRFPAKELDVSVLADSHVTWDEIRRRVLSDPKPLILKDVRLFDVYEGSKIPPNKKSLSFRLTYQADDRTLTDKEAGDVHQKILQDLTRAFNLTIRE